MWDSIKSSVDGEPGDMEISGHIDLDMRMKTENILPYINGEKRMLPKKSDLTFYNWDRGTAAYNSTDNFTVVAELPRLLLRHTGSDATLDITTSTPGKKSQNRTKKFEKNCRRVPRRAAPVRDHRAKLILCCMLPLCHKTHCTEKCGIFEIDLAVLKVNNLVRGLTCLLKNILASLA